MDLFEENLSSLIGQYNPNNINLSRDIYDFSKTETQNVSSLPYFLKVGKLENSAFAFPALVPFIDNKGIVYLYHKSEVDFSKLYIQNLLFELINKITPNQIEIVIYDPTFLGVPFNYISQVSLDNVSIELVTDENHLNTRLNKYIQYSKDLIGKTLIHFNGFIDYWANTAHNNKVYTIFILNDSHFVKNTATTDLINRITANTKNNNSFFILSDEEEKKANFNFFECDFIIQNQSYFHNEMKIDLEYDKIKEKIINNLSSIKEKRAKRTIVVENFNITEGLKIPIGVFSANKKAHYFRLGCGTENYHAIIGGQSGKGKSVLLNTIIKRGIEKYSANELKFLLCDCKGVEFNEYIDSDIKSILACESSSSVEKIVEKLKIVEQEFENRRELFKKNNVKSIEQLIDKGIELYRLVCIIDEFQFLFPSADYKTTQYSEDLLVSKIIRTGRSFGIHLIVATQSLGDSVRRSILDNIPLRIALGMTETQSNSFLSYNNDSAKNLDRGFAIYNDSNGEKDANKLIEIDKVD
jgi:hypothetical protein